MSDESPIQMRLSCPTCGELHVDEGRFATKAHHTHGCQFLEDFDTPHAMSAQAAWDAAAALTKLRAQVAALAGECRRSAEGPHCWPEGSPESWIAAGRVAAFAWIEPQLRAILEGRAVPASQIEALVAALPCPPVPLTRRTRATQSPDQPGTRRFWGLRWEPCGDSSCVAACVPGEAPEWLSEHGAWFVAPLGRKRFTSKAEAVTFADKLKRGNARTHVHARRFRIRPSKRLAAALAERDALQAKCDRLTDAAAASVAQADAALAVVEARASSTRLAGVVIDERNEHAAALMRVWQERDAIRAGVEALAKIVDRYTHPGGADPIYPGIMAARLRALLSPAAPGPTDDAVPEDWRFKPREPGNPGEPPPVYRGAVPVAEANPEARAWERFAEGQRKAADDARSKLAALVAAVEGLIRELPECECCETPATRFYDHHSTARRGADQYHLCDGCGPLALAAARGCLLSNLTGPYPIGYEAQLAALRALLPARGAEGAE